MNVQLSNATPDSIKSPQSTTPHKQTAVYETKLFHTERCRMMLRAKELNTCNPASLQEIQQNN